MIRVRTLGQCTIQIGALPVGPDAEMLFAALLLLTLEPGKRIGRAELLGTLWPDVPGPRAAHCLRQTIYRLRTLGVPLTVDRPHLMVSRDAVDCDVDALLRMRRGDEVERVADGIGGAFLPGYAPTFSAPLRDWVERRRDLVTAAARRVLVGALAARKARAEWADVERLAHRCLAIDPLNEEATLALAEAAALHGGKAEAMGILDRYLREMGPAARELRLPAIALRRRIAEPEQEFPLAPPPHVPFVGRSAEMVTLTAALRSARNGAGSVHFIHGEPGIGKTRLLAEFSRAASLDGARIAPVLCQSSDIRRPLSAFVDLVPKLLTMPGALGCSPQSHKYLRRLIEHHSSDSPPTPDTAEAAILYANVRRSLLDLLDAIASEVLLVVTIEDAQWLDAASREILSESASWVASRRILVLLTGRSGDEVEAITALLSQSVRWHRLAGLDEDALHTLLEANLRDRCQVVSASFRDWCVQLSGGNPYYLSELALNGLDPRGNFEVPPSLVTLVAERVSRLRPASRRVLQAFAVLGKYGSVDRIEAMLGERRTGLLDAFDELEQTRLLVLHDGKLVCHHGLLLEVALDRVSKAAFSYLHRKAATTLSASLRNDCQVSLAWDCARHLLAAGEPSQAVALLIDCARHALELGRPLEANEILAGSLELPLSSTERLSVLSERAHALRAAGQWSDAVRVLSEIVATQSRGGRLEHNDHELQLISARWAAGDDPKNLLTALRDCCAQRISTAFHRLRAARFAFMLADNVCEADMAHEIYQLINIDLIPSDGAAFDAVYCRMVYHVAFGDVGEAGNAANDLNAALSERSDLREVCIARTHVAEVLRESGATNQSCALLQQAYHEAVGNSLLWVACLAGRRLAWLCLDHGDLTGASEWIDAVIPISERIQHVASRADALGAAAELALQRGDARKAQAFLAESATAWKDTQHARSQALWLASQSGIWLAQGNRDACAEALPRFLELYQIVRRHCDQDQTTARLVRALQFTSQFELGERVLCDYLSTYRRGRAPLSIELSAICKERSLTLPAFMQRPEIPLRLLLRGAQVS